MHTWEEVVISLGLALGILGVFVGLLFIPVRVRRCADSYADAALPWQPGAGTAPGPVGKPVPCVDGVCGGPGGVPCDAAGACAPMGTCPDGGQAYRVRSTVGAEVFATPGRVLVVVGVLVVAGVVLAFFVYSRHSRRWLLRHTYKTQAPCGDAHAAGGSRGTYVYEPLTGSRTCTEATATGSDVIGCVCNDAPNLADGTPCETKRGCTSTPGVCYVMRQPCPVGGGETHSELHLKARAAA